MNQVSPEVKIEKPKMTQEDRLLIEINRQRSRNRDLVKLLEKTVPYINMARRSSRGVEKLYQEISDVLDKNDKNLTTS